MTEASQLPGGLVGRFAVVKLWPGIKTAEDECIARLQIAASALGLECVEIHADGRFIANDNVRASRENVDFVLHLHYDTPKQYDAFSFVALWNPIRFYHEWGYTRTSRNLTTHDDFISCLSTAADDHVARMVRGSGTHLPARFRLFHSTADIARQPGVGDGKLFYAGINWEALGGGKSRHGEVLKLLDATGDLRIYGPTIFQGVQVWAGYQSYVREVPFDGVSMLDEIARAGVALVLSSQAHKESGLMSNRLFESVAAGALVICDENVFASRHFGDALLYIDSRDDATKMAQDIQAHLRWARANPHLALEKIARAQAVFRARFTLISNLRELYAGLPERLHQLQALRNPPTAGNVRVRLYLLMPTYSPQVLQRHLQSAAVQTHEDLEVVLVADSAAIAAHRAEIDAAIGAIRVGVTLRPAEFSWSSPTGVKARRKLGEVFLDLLSDPGGIDAFMLVAPNEQLLSDHVAALAGALQRDPALQCAATAAVARDSDAHVHAVHEIIGFDDLPQATQSGYGRFIFRVAGLPQDLQMALPHLDDRAMAPLVGQHSVAQLLAATIDIDLRALPTPLLSERAVETAVIRDFSPAALQVRFGHGPQHLPVPPPPPEPPPPPLTLGRLVRGVFSIRWLRLQAKALRTYGVRERMKMVRRRLGLQ